MENIEYALEVNTLNSSSFPLSIDFKNKGNYYQLYLTALSVSEIAHIIIKYSDKHLTLFDIDHNDYEKSLEKICSYNNLKYLKYDSENISIESYDLPKLLENICHYNFHMFDSNLFLDEITYLTFKENLSLNKSENILTSFQDINNYIDVHDDCYFYLETKNIELVKEIISYLLNLYFKLQNFKVSISPLIIDEILNGSLPLLLSPEIPSKKNHINNSFVIYNNFFHDYIYNGNNLISERYFKINSTDNNIEIINDRAFV